MSDEEYVTMTFNYEMNRDVPEEADRSSPIGALLYRFPDLERRHLERIAKRKMGIPVPIEKAIGEIYAGIAHLYQD
jgi:hypothetical protein